MKYNSSKDYIEYRINGHGHLLPKPEQIPQFMRKKEIFWVSEDRKYMLQKNWSRPITDPSFFLEEKLEWMNRNNIDHSVLLVLSQLYCNDMDSKTAIDVCRFQNDFHGLTQESNPDLFSCGFVLPLIDVEASLKEMTRCVEELDLRLLCLPAQYYSPMGKWRSVAHVEMEPIWELANHYSLPIEIHPYDGPKFIDLEDEMWRFHLIWMCAQTADTYHFFTMYDYPSKYPNVRVCFAHGNQFGQVNVGRRLQGYKGRPDLFKNGVDPTKHIGAKNVFFDTLVHDIYSLDLLKRRQGVSQIIAGLDDPYPLGEMETTENSYPGKTLDECVNSDILNSSERRDIWFKNVLMWMDGDDNHMFKRLKLEGQKYEL